MILYSDAIYCMPARLLTTFDCPPYSPRTPCTQTRAPQAQHFCWVAALTVPPPLPDSCASLHGFTPVATPGNQSEAVSCTTHADRAQTAILSGPH